MLVAPYPIAFKRYLGQQAGMRRALILLLCPIVAACGSSERESGATTIALPETNASPAPILAAAVTPSSTVPGVWSHAPSARVAWYGPPAAPPSLKLSCEGWETRAARLVIERYAAADSGALALFAIQGSNGILRLPVSAVNDGQRGYFWRGMIDAADPRIEVLLGTGLKATVPGGGELKLTPLGTAGGLIAECIAAAARPVQDQTLPNRASNPATSPAAR